MLFDLPAHPDLLEQRIGRLDRIGQRHTIQLHVPHLENSAQQRLFQWYHQALNAFLNTCPTGNALQHEFGPRLLPLLDGGEDKAWDALLAEGRARREALEAELHSGRDRLLELNSGGAGEGEALVEAIEEQDDDFALPIYMERLFDAYGIHSEDHSENALILKPSEKMLDAGFPLGDDEGVTITYDRAQALAREDMQFLTWEHPMVQGGMDLVLSGSMGNTSVALIKNKALKPGTVLLELLFVSEAVAPRALQLGRCCRRRPCAACSTPTATTWPAGYPWKPSTTSWKACHGSAPTSSSRPSAMCWPSSSTWPRARSSRATRNAWPGPSSSSPPPWTRNWRA